MKTSSQEGENKSHLHAGHQLRQLLAGIYHDVPTGKQGGISRAVREMKRLTCKKATISCHSSWLASTGYVPTLLEQVGGFSGRHLARGSPKP